MVVKQLLSPYDTTTVYAFSAGGGHKHH